MRTVRAFGGIGLLAAVALAATVAAGEPANPLGPQPSVTHPLATALLGTWTTKVTGSITGSGTSTFTLGAADTVVLLDEKGEHRLGDAPPVKDGGHAVYKIAADGKSMTAWWIDNQMPTLVKVSGTLTATGFDLTGDDPLGKVRVALQKTGTGLEFRLYVGGWHEPFYTRTYERAPGGR